MTTDGRRYVFLMPECCDDWAAVIVEHPTGVVHQQQYGGTLCRQAYVEGYLVPVPVTSHEAVTELRDVFEGELLGAGAGGGIRRRDADVLERVRAAVGALKMAPSDGELRGTWVPLAVDDSRLDELDEAFVPVLTPDGPGWLVWNNSD